jgi:hypothetical protein
VIVAVVAIVTGSLLARRRGYTLKAAHHAQISRRLQSPKEAFAALMADFDARHRSPKRGTGEWERIEPSMPWPLYLRRVEWHNEMRQKYERAARYPWLPVAPDEAIR